MREIVTILHYRNTLKKRELLVCFCFLVFVIDESFLLIFKIIVNTDIWACKPNDICFVREFKKKWNFETKTDYLIQANRKQEKIADNGFHSFSRVKCKKR